jgi:hypothetical protein
MDEGFQSAQAKLKTMQNIFSHMDTIPHKQFKKTRNGIAMNLSLGDYQTFPPSTEIA